MKYVHARTHARVHAHTHTHTHTHLETAIVFTAGVSLDLTGDE